jgi:uncharacterized protein DUF5679
MQEEQEEQITEAPPQLHPLAYCFKCKAKTEILAASEFTMKNGRLAIRGTCVVCGSSITRLGGLR